MATKAELESASHRYAAYWASVRSAAVTREYPAAMRAAEASLAVAWAAVAYQRRYQKVERPELPTVEAILRYAPPLFDWQRLDVLDAWLSGAKRTDKALYAHLRADIEASRRSMALAARLWDDADALAPSPVPPEARAAARAIVTVWTDMGVVALRPESAAAVVRHVTNPEGQVLGKCSVCGTSLQASLNAALNPTACRECGQASEFVIVRRFF